MKKIITVNTLSHDLCCNYACIMPAILVLVALISPPIFYAVIVLDSFEKSKFTCKIN